MQQSKSLPAQRQKPPKDNQEDEAEMKNHYQIGKETVHEISIHSLMEMLARIFHESAYGGPQGVVSEAYLNDTWQGELVLSDPT
jgi:hypothetical protein